MKSEVVNPLSIEIAHYRMESYSYSYIEEDVIIT